MRRSSGKSPRGCRHYSASCLSLKLLLVTGTVQPAPFVTDHVATIIEFIMPKTSKAKPKRCTIRQATRGGRRSTRASTRASTQASTSAASTSPAIARGIPPNMPASTEQGHQSSELLAQLLQLLQSHQTAVTAQAATDPSNTNPTPEQVPTSSSPAPTLPQTGTLHAFAISYDRVI